MLARAAALLLLAALLAGGGPATAAAQQAQRIAAVVNNEVVTLHEVTERLRLLIFASQLPDSEEMRRRLAPQVLRTLIEERLKMQEAQRLNVTVSDTEIQQALAGIERQNNLPPGQLMELLRQNGIDRRTLIDQYRASLAWAKVVRRRAVTEIRVSPEEIDDVLARLQADRGKEEYLLAEIFLPVDEPSREADVGRLAERLLEQIRRGTPFAAVASQFSQSSSAAGGGDLGWVQRGQLDEQLEAALEGLRPGMIAGPVRVAGGISLLLLRDRRLIGGNSDPTVTLSQVFLPVAPGASDETRRSQRELAASIAETAGSCADMKLLAEKANSPRSSELGTVKVGQLAERMRRLVNDLKVNEASAPVDLDDGVLVLMVCDRQDEPQLPSREAISRRLEGERLEFLGRQYLRDLRRNAFLDVRV